MSYLNQDVEFEEVRWATVGKAGYDAGASFAGVHEKKLLPAGTRLFRLMYIVDGRYFDAVWWMPKDVFEELHADANRARHGGGRLFRNYIAQYMALPSGSFQLSIVEIELKKAVYGWVGRTATLFQRPGGMRQVFLPNLAERGQPRWSPHARVTNTYWLQS